MADTLSSTMTLRDFEHGYCAPWRFFSAPQPALSKGVAKSVQT
jgi:hypothetical protein